MLITSETGVLSQDHEDIKIANITFAFMNYDIISLLKQRGSALTNAKFDKADKLEEKICEIKNANIDRLDKPISAYITFETQEGYERACNIKSGKTCFFFDSYSREYMGTPLAFTEAPEPTNIIWEHRHIGGMRQFIRKVLVAIMVFIVLLLALVMFYGLKLTIIKNQKKYPSSTNCIQLDNLFTNEKEYEVDLVWQNPKYLASAKYDKKPTIDD